MPVSTPIFLPAGKPCITDTAEECQKCLSARLSMVDKKLKPGVWGDPPSFRQTINPVATRAASSKSGTSGGSADGGRGMRSWAPVSTAAAAASAGGLRSLHTSSIAGQQPAAAAASTAVPGAAAGILASSTLSSGPAKGSDVPRTNIGIFGCMNAGKSSLMNRITRSEFSIVDSTPGTTADTKVALMELHDLGPAKLFDTGRWVRWWGRRARGQGIAGRGGAGQGGGHVVCRNRQRVGIVGTAAP